MTALEVISNWYPVGILQNNIDQKELISYYYPKCALLIDNTFELILKIFLIFTT